MIIIPFLLYHAFLLIGKLCVTFTCGVIFAVIGAALLNITHISIDTLHNFCILIKKNVFVFLYVFYAILCIDIVNILLYQVQEVLVNEHGYHI